MQTRPLLGPHETCFGCGACAQICPQQAIQMCADSEGFLYPIFSPDNCVECGLCSRACPSIPEYREKILKSPQEVFAARNKDLAMLMRSTSGALFPVFANAVISQGGVVYGCAWLNNKLLATHIRVDNERELSRLTQSKYVQSSTEETFRTLRKDLRRKVPVLYSGTPCQIAGLRLFLGKEYPNLLAIDLLCHGVPSPLMFSSYIAELEKREHGQIVDFKFRDKLSSGFRAYVSYVRPNGKKRFRLAGLEPYLYGFYRELFNRESCYRCPFQQIRRVGDITLADYWGLEIHHPELVDWNRYGASLCMFNTQRGLHWKNLIAGDVELVNSRAEFAARNNPALNTAPESHQRPELRTKIYQELLEHGFEWIASRYLRRRFFWIHQLIPAQLKNFLLFIRRYL